jgi:hypothetical protein
VVDIRPVKESMCFESTPLAAAAQQSAPLRWQRSPEVNGDLIGDFDSKMKSCSTSLTESHPAHRTMTP